MNGYNGYGHESAYVTPHSMNQVTFSKQQQDGTESNMNILKRTTSPFTLCNFLSILSSTTPSSVGTEAFCEDRGRTEEQQFAVPLPM